MYILELFKNYDYKVPKREEATRDHGINSSSMNEIHDQSSSGGGAVAYVPLEEVAEEAERPNDRLE